MYTLRYNISCCLSTCGPQTSLQQLVLPFVIKLCTPLVCTEILQRRKECLT